jgi:MFS family permease
MQPYPRRWQALAVLAFSLLVITMGNTILNVGLPTIQEELDASSSQLQWIVDSYLLVFAGLLLAAGSLRDRFSRKHALLSGLVVFGLGSGFAALATDATTLIASRAVMGLGAAGIMPTTLSTLTDIFPADERPKAIAAWAAVSASASRSADFQRLLDRALRLEQHLSDQPAGRRHVPARRLGARAELA